MQGECRAGLDGTYVSLGSCNRRVQRVTAGRCLRLGHQLEHGDPSHLRGLACVSGEAGLHDEDGGVEISEVEVQLTDLVGRVEGSAHGRRPDGQERGG